MNATSGSAPSLSLGRTPSRAGGLALSMMVATAASACSRGPYGGPGSGAAADDARFVVDLAERRVALPGRVDRVATGGASLFSILLTVGAGPKIVAVSSEIRRNPWVSKVLPRLPDIGTAYDEDNVDVEAVLRARPDVVFQWSAASASSRRLESAGIPVVVVNYRTPDELSRAVSLAGAVLGPSEAAAAARFNARYRDVVRRVEGAVEAIGAGRRVRVYYAAGDPLTTEGQASFAASWIEIAGGVNVAAVAGVLALRASVSMETVLLWNPDVVVTRDAVTRAAILADPRWSSVRAVQAGRIFVSPKGVTAWCTRGGESLLQPLWAAKALYPETFSDLDLAEPLRGFYLDFLGYRLTDREIDDILVPRR